MPECLYPSPNESIGDRDVRGLIQRLVQYRRKHKACPPLSISGDSRFPSPIKAFEDKLKDCGNDRKKYHVIYYLHYKYSRSELIIR